ncbi:Heterokaryon incompatibility protein (HET) domain containing protein [Rhypophila decipiens]
MDTPRSDAHTLAPYSYQPLQQGHFRFIELLPGLQDGPVRTRIFHSPIFASQVAPKPRMSLAEVRTTLPPGWNVEQAMDSRYIFIFETDSDTTTSWLHPDPNFDLSFYFPPLVPKHRPKYEALSYAWGIDTTVSPIIVDTLQHLRTSRTARTLWIDAICINQADRVEKTTQITKMGSIYSLAYRVEDDSDIALSVLKEVGSRVESPSAAILYPSPDATRNARDAIQSLVWRPWFRRLWVIQEVQLASTISILQCGRHDISLRLFVNSIQLLVFRSMLSVSSFPSKSLGYLLRYLAPLNCSEPRDKIYGLLALLPQRLVHQIKPDYGIPTKEMYKHVLWFDYIVSGEEPPETRDQNLSWVPDWTLEWRYHYNRGIHQWASGCSRAHFTYQNPGTLVVEGVICGTVSTISDIAPEYSVGSEYSLTQRLQAWITSLGTSHNGIYQPTGEPASLALAANLTGLRYVERLWQVQVPRLEEWTKILGISSIPGNTDTLSLDPNIKLILGMVSNRRYITMEEGFMRLAPTFTQSGDKVVVLLGCDSPLILRPLPNGEYRLVGKAIVYGLQDAEGLLGRLPAPWTLKVKYQCATEYHAGPYSFWNPDTGEMTDDDPRLPPLGPDSEWEYCVDDGCQADWQCKLWRHKITGETTHCDPRMSIESLKARGVNIVTLRLE